MNNTLQLEPRHDARLSFYGKARIEASYPLVKLWSYETNVATIALNGKPDDKGTVQVFGTYSATTLRHIKEFLKQYGFKADNKQQILADYGVKQS